MLSTSYSSEYTATHLFFLLETRFASDLQTLAAASGEDASGARTRRRRVVRVIEHRINPHGPLEHRWRTSGREERAGALLTLLHCAHKSERAHASQMSDDAAATTPPKPQEERTSCWLELDALYSCATPKHQFEVVYRDGTFDDCQQRAADMWACMRGGAARRRPRRRPRAKLSRRRRRTPGS